MVSIYQMIRFDSQDRGVMHITEALIEQAKYFKTLHDTNPPAQCSTKLQYSNMLTLTKGEKLQSLLESVAKHKHFDSLTATTMASQFSKIQEETNVANKPTLPLVKLFEKINNNNVLEEHLTPPMTPDVSQTKTDQIELNIIEQNNGQEKSGGENSVIVDDGGGGDASKDDEGVAGATIVSNPSLGGDLDSTRTSISAMSIDSDKYSDVDTSPQPPLDNNNTLSDSNDIIVTSTEESVSTATEAPTGTDAVATPPAEKRSRIIEGIEEATEATTDAQLDINENQTESDAIQSDPSVDNSIHINTPNVNVNDAPILKPAAAAISNGDDETNDDSTTKIQVNDLDGKVQSVENAPVSQPADGVAEKSTPTINTSVRVEPLEKIASTPIQVHPNHGTDEDDDNMSPLLNSRQPLNSPRMIKTKDIMSELPLTPDSSHSLDSSCEYSTPFEIKSFNPAHIPERSFSSESLNSETSVDSNDSKSSLKLTEAKFSKNGTLERQTPNGMPVPNPSSSAATGLQVLMLWNNRITRNASQSVAELLTATTTLEILNVGRNLLSNDFISNIKGSLKANTSLTSLGLQSSHLSSDGVKSLADVLDFGGNVTLQRIDLRDNNLQVSGLTSLNEVLKSNKSVTRIDLDDMLRRNYVSNKKSFCLYCLSADQFY